MRRLLGLLLASVLLALLPASPALAHAALVESTPADGVVLQDAPGEVVLRFNQPVGIALGAVRVVGPDGERVDDGAPQRRDGGKEVAVGLTEASARGTYVLLWRVMSEDSHAVSGASVFSVGAASEPATAAEAEEAGVGLPLRASRLLSYVGVLVLVGAVLVPALVWRDGLQRRSVRRLLVVGTAMAAVGTVGSLLAQGPNAAGLPLTRALDLLPEVLGTRFGATHVARLALLGVLAAVLVVLVRSRRPVGRGALVVLAALGLPLLATWSLAGHPAAGSLTAVAVPLDALHLLAVGAWAGGLVVLVAAVLRERDPEVLTGALERWSRLATVAVVAMVVTGGFAAWREVRALDALGGTDYGRLLLLKLVLVLAMLYAGARGREVVRRQVRRRAMVVAHASVATVEAPPPAAERLRELRRSTWAEVVLATVVVLVTTVLVDTPPAASDYARPLSTVQQVDDDLRVQLDLDSARVGANTLHVYLTGPGGKAMDVPEVTGRIVRADGDSLPLRIGRISLGHYEATNSLVVPYKGEWELQIAVRTSDVDSSTVRQTLTFR